MNRWHAFSQLILTRVREFYREPEAVFWVYGFPIILAFGLGIAFSGGPPPPPDVDVVAQSDPAPAERLAKLLRDEGLKVEIKTFKEAHDRLRQGKTALYLFQEGDQLKYRFRPEGELARRWVDGALARGRLGKDAPQVEPLILRDPGNRYIDFLLPGLIGMNLIGGGLFGVGFVLVDMRVRKLFKRLLATPMHRGDFLLSILTARFVFLVPEMLALFLIGRLYFGVPVYGSPLTLAAVIVLGAFAFSGIGLLLACRTDKTETISGLINLVILPMYLLSGVFFSSRRFPDEVQPFIQALPLTQVNDALREVMLEGRSLAYISWRLALLMAWGGVTFVLALRWFRWR
jgi:ABC-2 type transport system permease protein